MKSLSKPFVLVLSLLFLFLGTPTIYAQGTGSISGKVVDVTSGDPLIGVNVYLIGTSIGAATNLEGEYILQQIPAGEYTVGVKYIGYKDQSVPATVKAKSTLELNFELQYVVFEGEEVVITAQARGQLAAINQQLSSNTIKNIVSSDRIEDVPDVNAAESVARLPGLSLIRSGGEGQKVAIRGLSPKYNVMQVNGVRMQSTDRDDRSVDLNMIAPNILSGIEVTKAITADMDADAVGGMVNLKIAKAPDEFRGKFSVQNGYGSMANTFGNFRVNGLLSNRFFDKKFGVQVSAFVDKFNRNSDVLSAGYALNEEAVLEDGFIPIDLASVSITDRATDRQRLGGGLVLDYQFSNGSIIMNNFISNLSQEQVVQQNSLSTGANQWSAFTQDNEMNNTVLSNALQGEFDFSFFSMDFSVSNSMSKQYYPGDMTMRVGIAQGEAGFSTDLEDPLKATPSELLGDAEIIPDLTAKRAQRFYTLERDVLEIGQEAALNFTVPFSITQAVSGNIKFGGKYVRNTRDSDETQLYSTPDRTEQGEEFVRVMKDSLWTDLGIELIDQNLGIRALLFENPDYDIGNDFLSGDAGVDNFFYLGDPSKMRHLEELAIGSGYYLLAGQESAQYDYDYRRNLQAYYAMAEINVGKYVTLFPGIRYEDFSFDYNAFSSERYGPNPEDFRNEPMEAENGGDNWFPQLHIRMKPTEWLNLRLASTRSIIYPDYRAISPFIYYDSWGDPTLNLGNTELTPAYSQNYDIYASVSKNYLGLFTAGYFYKAIDNLMVSSSFRTKDSETINNRFELRQTQQTNVSTWINLDATSYVKGFELDWQTHFWYLPSFLKGIVFNINYTHITSETIYPFQTSVKQGTGPFAKTVFVDSTRTGRMPNQPDDVLNMTIGYDIGGFSARLSFVYQDNVLRGVNRTYDELDTYTGSSERWDFTAYQVLPWLDGKLQVYLNVNNITNTADRAFTSTLGKLSSLEYYGRTADLGLRYKF